MLAQEFRRIAFGLLGDARQVEGNVVVVVESLPDQKGFSCLPGPRDHDGRKEACQLDQPSRDRPWECHMTIFTL
jgi:hypothetical protein